MRLRDPLARTHARRLHTIRLHGQSHPLPPFTTPTQPRYEDHANQNRSFAFFLFFQNRPSPFCPYLCYRFNHAITLSPSFSFSLTIVFTKNSTLLFPSLLSPYEILLLVDARKKSKKYASSGKIGNQ